MKGTTIKNQTLKEHRLITHRGRNVVRGIGMFVIKNEIENKYLKTIVQDISYRRAVDFGRIAIAFKFLPYGAKIKIGNRLQVLNDYESIPRKDWICTAKCNETDDCVHLSDVCICAEGQCF